jgi:hypothetical protein
MDTTTLAVSAALGVATSAVTAYVTAQLRLRQVRAEGDRELTLRLAEASGRGRDEVGQLVIVTNRFEPNPAMDDSYFLEAQSPDSADK